MRARVRTQARTRREGVGGEGAPQAADQASPRPRQKRRVSRQKRRRESQRGCSRAVSACIQASSASAATEGRRALRLSEPVRVAERPRAWAAGGTPPGSRCAPPAASPATSCCPRPRRRPAPPRLTALHVQPGPFPRGRQDRVGPAGRPVVAVERTGPGPGPGLGRIGTDRQGALRARVAAQRRVPGGARCGPRLQRRPHPSQPHPSRPYPSRPRPSRPRPSWPQVAGAGGGGPGARLASTRGRWSIHHHASALPQSIAPRVREAPSQGPVKGPRQKAPPLYAPLHPPPLHRAGAPPTTPSQGLIRIRGCRAGGSGVEGR